MYLRLKPVPAIGREIDQTIARCGGAGAFAAVHMRRTDFVALFEQGEPRTADSSFISFVDSRLAPIGGDGGDGSDGSRVCRSVLVATDNAATQRKMEGRFGERFRSTRPIGPPPLTASPTDPVRHTAVADAVVDLFVCVESSSFMGTLGSSFSDTIWLLRRARGQEEVVFTMPPERSSSASAIHIPRHLLHACELKLQHPETQKPLTFKSDSQATFIRECPALTQLLFD